MEGEWECHLRAMPGGRAGGRQSTPGRAPLRAPAPVQLTQAVPFPGDHGCRVVLLLREQAPHPPGDTQDHVTARATQGRFWGLSLSLVRCFSISGARLPLHFHNPMVLLPASVPRQGLDCVWCGPGDAPPDTTAEPYSPSPNWTGPFGKAAGFTSSAAGKTDPKQSIDDLQAKSCWRVP